MFYSSLLKLGVSGKLQVCLHGLGFHMKLLIEELALLTKKATDRGHFAAGRQWHVLIKETIHSIYLKSCILCLHFLLRFISGSLLSLWAVCLLSSAETVHDS